MPKRALTIFCGLLLYRTALPLPSLAWGLDVHRFVTDRVIQALPPTLRPFFEKHRLFVIEHSVDPDLWRNVGFVEEPPKHFLDLDAFGVYPFKELPHDQEIARHKFGREILEKEGQVPWRVVEIYERLVQAFEQQKEANNRYAPDNVKFLTAVLSHYVSDAHVPFHTVKNYDGQLTQQTGIHSRFETELFLRYQKDIDIPALSLYPVEHPLDRIFEILLNSFTLVDPILKDDLRASEGLDSYDEVYFERFFRRTRRILEKQLADSINATASMVVSAWQKAGQPDLSVEVKPMTRKIRP